MYEHFSLSKYNIYYKKHYHTLLTSAFSHFNFWHLGFNMFTFYFFGRVVEATFGRLPLLQLYLFGGALCSVFSLQHANRYYGDITYMGASGGLASVLTFFILNFPRETIYVYFIPVPAWALGAFIAGYSLLNYDSRASVSHAGHLGGIVAGAVYFALKRRI